MSRVSIQEEKSFKRRSRELIHRIFNKLFSYVKKIITFFFVCVVCKQQSNRICCCSISFIRLRTVDELLLYDCSLPFTVFLRSSSACCSSCDQGNAPIECNPFRLLIIYRAILLAHRMMADLVHPQPSSSTLCCTAHGDNVQVFPNDNHHVPVHTPEQAHGEIKMGERTRTINTNKTFYCMKSFAAIEHSHWALLAKLHQYKSCRNATTSTGSIIFIVRHLPSNRN